MAGLPSLLAIQYPMRRDPKPTMVRELAAVGLPSLLTTQYPMAAHFKPDHGEGVGRDGLSVASGDPMYHEATWHER